MSYKDLPAVPCNRTPPAALPDQLAAVSLGPLGRRLVAHLSYGRPAGQRAAVFAVWGRRWAALDPADRPRYRDRLRRLRADVNDRFLEAGLLYHIGLDASGLLAIGGKPAPSAWARSRQAGPAWAAHLAGLKAMLLGRPFRKDADGRPSRGPLTIEEAMHALTELLKDGERTATEAESSRLYDLTLCGPGTHRRARERLGVVSRRVGFGPGGRWLWSLPENRPPVKARRL